MADTSYTYSISADFKNGAIDSGVLWTEVKNSPISSAVSRKINTDGDNCYIWFNNPLSSGDLAILDNLVSVHDGIPHPEQLVIGEYNTAGDEALRVGGTGRFDGGVRTVRIPTPSAPVVTPVGTTGSTSWAYKVSAVSDVGETSASDGTAIVNGSAVLDSTNYNYITWNEEIGAMAYNVYRTVAGGTPSSTGLIATVYPGELHLEDTGLSASGSVLDENTTARIIIGEDETVSIDRDDSGNLLFSDASGAGVSLGRVLETIMMTLRGDGYYRNCDGIDITEAREDFEISSVIMRREIAGSGGQTVVDILKNGTTIFTTPANRPTILASAGDEARTTATPDVVSVSAGDRLEMEVVEAEDGDPQDVVVFINRV